MVGRYKCLVGHMYMLLTMIGNMASWLYGVPGTHVVISDLGMGIGGPVDPMGVRRTTKGPAEPMGLLDVLWYHL